MSELRDRYLRLTRAGAAGHVEAMKVQEASETRLVFVDTQLDKKLGIGVASAVLLFMAYQFAETGEWLIAAIPAALVIGGLVYLWLSYESSVFTFDKPEQIVSILIENVESSDVFSVQRSTERQALLRGGSVRRKTGRDQPCHCARVKLSCVHVHVHL